MATDVARVSYDYGRRYTDTVPQQGRVSLEAEENEQHAILDAERLADLRDIIGPAGTPDNGYAITDAGGGDIDIGPGTMYVGGLRVWLDQTIAYSAQPDWVDCDGDPAFTPVSPAVTGNEHAVLVLTEYDVTATEDPVLREVALGGPDGSARRRIVQRVRRLATTAADCQGAAVTDVQAWLADGLIFDPATMRLNSGSALQVTWTGPPPQPDPCEPTATGGYLGAENQVIRVQVAADNPSAGTFDLVWGWDNGSALYRVTPGAGGQFVLDRAPVDDFHNPQAGQPVELLRSAAGLDSTDGVTEGWVAELTGQIAVLAAPYDPDTRTVVYPASLPSQYLDPTQTPQLYLRVWEELHTGVAAGDTVALTGTGLSVTLTLPGDGVHPGDYWSIGVRPATPDTVLPDRLLRTPQPPDGPRMWACPLAVIGWNKGVFTLLDDCRVPFPPLTGIQPGAAGCCTISVEPKDADRLQQIIDQATAGRRPNDVSRRVTVCLRPGIYLLPRPLLLGTGQGELHLEGCGGGVVLAAAPGKEAAFTPGLVVLVQADAVTISGITFDLPQAALQAESSGALRTSDPRITAIYRNLEFSIGLRVIACQDLTVTDCSFNFDATPAKQGGTPADPAPPDPPPPGAVKRVATEVTQVIVRVASVFAVGILTAGRCDRLSVIGCRFTYASTDQATTSPRALRIRVGLLSTPALTWAAASGRAKSPSAAESLLASWLDDALIRDNSFTGLTVGICALGYLAGLRLEDNTLRDCYGGVWLIAADALLYLDLIGSYQARGITQQAMTALNATVQGAVLDPVLLFLVAVGWTIPLPDAAAGASAAQAGGKAVTAQEMTTQRWTTGLVSELATDPAPSVTRGTTIVAPLDEEAAERAQSRFGGAAASQAELVAAGGAEATLREAAFTVADYARAFPLPVSQLDAVLQVRGNALDCAQPNLYSQTSGAEISGPTGAALLIWVTSSDRKQVGSGPGSVIIDANEFSATSRAPVVTVVLAPAVTVTGNLVRRDREGYSLAILGTAGAAITGNVLIGGSNLLPGRSYPAPFDTWLPMNTVL